jgi:hypothetical protein
MGMNHDVTSHCGSSNTVRLPRFQPKIAVMKKDFRNKSRRLCNEKAILSSTYERLFGLRT